MRSLTSRLVLATVGLVAIVALAIGATTTVAMRAYLTDQQDHEVSAAMGFVLGPGSDGPGDPDDHPGDGLGRSLGMVTAQFAAGSTQADGTVVTVDPVSERPAPQALTPAQLVALREVPADNRVHGVSLPGLGHYRVKAVSRVGGTIVVGLPNKAVDDVITSLVWWEIFLALLAIAAAGSAGLLVVRRQLAPLREVAATAHEVAALPLSSGEVDLSARVQDPDERTEVGQVGAALNTLLTHVEASLEARHRSEQQVRQFVADASHELRTPLSTIRGYAEFAARTPDDAAVLGASMAKVSAEADRMSSLVEDLLLLARLDSGRPLEREPVDLTHLLLEAVTDARLLGPDHQWRLELPEDPVEVLGDALRLHQVVTNLLGNARRHTPPGTTVTVRASATPEGAVLEVADDGPGFPPDMADHAFERFSRADVARTRTSGSVGLGLAIVDAIVAAHGGTVGLVSSASGATITVHLPSRPTEA